MTEFLTRNRVLGWCAFVYGIAVFVVIIVGAIINLSSHVVQALQYDLSPMQWIVMVINVVLMAYYEGLKGFQRSYSPRLVARAKSLVNQRTLRQLLLAPAFCMGFFDAPHRRVIAAYLLTVVILAFVFIFRALPQPWRGVLDVGVIVGLSWGLTATFYFLIKYVRSPNETVSPEIVSAPR